MYATIRVPSDKNPARRASARPARFATTKRGVLALADWLRCWQVPAVVMEATGDYWKGPFYRLEAEGFECVLADAKQVKNLPGRPKRDPSTPAGWRSASSAARSGPASCRDPEFRIIRLHTRYRRDLTDERTREKNRAEKLLESAAIKLSSVVTDLHGVTGRDIMDHLIAGERNPKVLAQLARARARRKITELEHALDGAEFFTAEHAAPAEGHAGAHRRTQRPDRQLTAVIERLLAPYEEQLQQAESMPGLGAALRPGRPRRDRRRHEQVPHRRPPGPPGPGAPRWTTSPASAPAGPGTRKATSTWAPSPARPPSPPARPRPAKAPATASSPAAAARPKPRSRSATPS